MHLIVIQRTIGFNFGKSTKFFMHIMYIIIFLQIFYLLAFYLIPYIRSLYLVPLVL